MGKKKFKKAVGYIRVSTQKQGLSGLGLAAQQAAIAVFCEAHGLELVAEFRETESGKHNDRQELKRAIARCRRAKAILIIAKLDRLARNVAFVANLMDSDIDFFACDYPNDDRFMLHIRAAIAEDEARRISERTKAALAAAKRRGVILGTDNLTRKGTLKGAATMKRLASERNADLVPTIKRLHARSQSLRAIAEEVGLACMTVSRILARNQ